jgi:DME family drug/metabolite transporter
MLALGGSGDSGGGDKNYLLGTLLALGAGFSYSSFTILTKLATRHTQAGTSQTVALAFTMGALMLLPIAFFTGNLRLDLALGVWLIAAYMGLVPTGLAYVVFMNALRYASATAASIVTLLEPAVAAVLAWLLLGESISLLTVSGAVLLLFSVWLLSRKG